jgi:hypothetical protein
MILASDVERVLGFDRGYRSWRSQLKKPVLALGACGSCAFTSMKIPTRYRESFVYLSGQEWESFPCHNHALRGRRREFDILIGPDFLEHWAKRAYYNGQFFARVARTLREIPSLAQENESLAGELAAALATIKQLRTRLLDEADEVSELHETIDCLRGENEALQSDLHSVNVIGKTLQKRNGELERLVGSFLFQARTMNVDCNPSVAAMPAPAIPALD